MKFKNTVQSDNMPSVSVIIPCYNDEKGLYDTLTSLELQKYPKHLWEVIVIDNNSNDNTHAIAKSFISKIPKLVILEEAIQSSYAARNKGIVESTGSILIFIDSDMKVKTDCITSCVDELTRQNAVYIGGNVDIYSNSKENNIFEKYDMLTGFPISDYIRKRNFACTCCLIVKRSLIDSIGMFDSNLRSGGDFEFGNRVKDYGFNLHYSHTITFKHPTRSSLNSHFKKAIRVAHGVADLKLLYPYRFGRLNTLFIMTSFIPILKSTIKPGNTPIPKNTKISIFILTNLFHYIRAFTLLSRYLRSTAKF